MLVSNRKNIFCWRAVSTELVRKMKKIKTNLFISVAYQLIAIIYGFILPRLIIEKFGSEVNGLTQSIAQFLGIISFLDMGVGQVVRSALYSPLEQQDHTLISCIMVSGRRFYRTLALALLGYVAVLVMAYPLLVDKSFGWLFTAGMIIIMAVGSFAQYYFGIIQEQFLHAVQKSYLIYGLQILCYLVNLVVCVCMIRLNCSIHAVKLATTIIFLIKPFFYTWYIWHNHDINWRIAYDAEPIKQKWHGIAQHISAVVLDGTDNIVLTFFSTLSNVSVYSVYYMIIGSIQGIYQTAAVGIQSAAGAMWAKQDALKIRQMFSAVEFVLHTATVFLFSCTGVLIVPFVQVYTNGLTDAYYYQPLFASILVMAYGVRCLRTPYNIWILAAGHFKQTQRCHITAATLNLSLSVFAVSCWGLVGVAIGTLVAMCYQTVWMAVYATRNLVRCSVGHLLKQCFGDVASVVLIFGATSRITLQDVSYWGWIIMAVRVAVIATVCISCTSFLFYRKQAMRLIKKLWLCNM